MSEIIRAAEMYYDEHNDSYSGLCSQGSGTDYYRIKKNIEDNGGIVTCHDTADIPPGDAYCMQSDLSTGGSWCVDSWGFLGAAANCDGTYYTCASD